MTGSVSTGSLSLWLLVGWGILCAAWNLYGAVPLGPPLGPTASYAGAGLTLALALVFVVTSGRLPLIYKLLAAVAGAIAGFTVWNAFALDPSNWNLQFWRWAGAALNAVGVVGGLLAILGR